MSNLSANTGEGHRPEANNCSSILKSNHTSQNDAIHQPPSTPIDVHKVASQVLDRIVHNNQVSAYLLSQTSHHFTLARADMAMSFERIDSNNIPQHHAYHPYTCHHANGKVHLMTIRNELAIHPLPIVFLQTRMWSLLPPDATPTLYPPRSTARPLVCTAFDWRDSSDYSPNVVATRQLHQIDDSSLSSSNSDEDIPIPLLDVIGHDSPWPWFTDTQLIDFVTRVVVEMDTLPAPLFFVASLTSVLLVNPTYLGTSKPLSFRFCPFSLITDKEFSIEGVSKSQVVRHYAARFILHMATRLEDLNSPLLKKCLVQSFTRSPGIVTAFFDLWRSTSNNTDIQLPGVTDAIKLTIDASPSLFVFNAVRSRALSSRRNYKIEHVPGLLSAIRCHDSTTMHSSAVDGLWRFILGATKSELAEAVGIITQCIGCLVPSEKATALTDPASSSRSASWILRMNIIDRVLFENERSGDYARLRRTQQLLLTSGIGAQLGGSIVSHNSKFSLKVLMPIVRVSTLASFRFPTLAARLIFDRNVRKMARMCFDAEPKGDIHHTDCDRFLSMMLVMSDFKKWCGVESSSCANNKSTVVNNKDANIDEKLLSTWSSLDDDTFLLYALPCWTPSLGDATTAALVLKLEAAFYRCVRVYIQSSSDSNEQMFNKNKLMYILDWLVAFAWNAPEQVSAASYQSLYTSYFLGLVFRNPAQSIFFDAVPAETSNNTPFLLDEMTDDDDTESTLLPHLDNATSVAVDQLKLDSTCEVDSAQVNSPLSTTACDFLAHRQTTTRHHPLFSNGIDVPWTTPVENIQSAVHFMDDTFEPSNPENLTRILRTFKFAVTPRNLYGFVNHHQNGNLSVYYTPTPNHHGAPTSKDSAFFNIPAHRNDLVYHQKNTEPTLISSNAEDKYNTIRTLLIKEMQQLDVVYDKFEPVTLATNHRLCHTKGGTPVQGTTGMMEINLVDSGETNDIVFGVTWNLEADVASSSSTNNGDGLKTLIPGRTSHSIGIAVATGHVHLLENGKRNKLPYTIPFGTSSRLYIGIAYNKIYFIVDNVFYPPIPNLTIPDDCDIYGLVRLGCGGIKLTTRSLTNCWRLERDENGVLKDTKTNPIAHTLYLAELRTKVCPHYHAHRRSRVARPQLSDSIKGGVDYLALPEEARDLIDRVHLANITCTEGDCPASKYLRNTINSIINNASKGSNT